MKRSNQSRNFDAPRATGSSTPAGGLRMWLCLSDQQTLSPAPASVSSSGVSQERGCPFPGDGCSPVPFPRRPCPFPGEGCPSPFYNNEWCLGELQIPEAHKQIHGLAVVGRGHAGLVINKLSRNKHPFPSRAFSPRLHSKRCSWDGGGCKRTIDLSL